MLGAAQMGANCVIGWDLDKTALQTCQSNIDENDLNINCILIQANLITPKTSYERLYGKLDVCVTNPPFGTKNNAGQKIIFLFPKYLIVFTRDVTLYAQRYLNKTLLNRAIKVKIQIG